MEGKEKQPARNKSAMTAGEIQARDYASCKLARQFWSLLYGIWSLLYGARMRNRIQVAGDQ